MNTEKIAEVNLLYSLVLINLGICIGFYIMPFFFKKTDKYTFEDGVLYGILYHKRYLHEKGTFDYVSDSSVLIKTGRDSFMMYK